MPERTCVGCRGRAPKNELVRLVARQRTVVIDASQTAEGRGAYLHPGCGRLAQRGGRVQRALRATGLDAESVREVLDELDESAPA